MGTLGEKEKARLKRKKRVRKNMFGTEERPRLSVFRSARHVYAQVVVEGLYGARLSLAGLSLSPRLGDWPGSIAVHQPANGLFLRYNYRPTDKRLEIAYETNHQAPTFPLHLLLPPGFTPGGARLDGAPLAWEQLTLGQDTYLTATLPTGYHFLVVESHD